MGWTVPPLGWCAVCLTVYANTDDADTAVTTFKGTALCMKHLRMVADEKEPCEECDRYFKTAEEVHAAKQKVAAEWDSVIGKYEGKDD